MTIRVRTAAITAWFALAACSSEPAPVDPAVQAERTDPKGNPLEGTVLDAQGEALKKARGVQDTLDAAAQRKMDEADAASQ
ncbi:MAG: hypothetical protein IPG63_08235 [Xanthomonadales bacterium]|nr:hypothetical protein [Xanthomonadales bacterium]MBK7144423.1 hypothetical protein [Xanthomonadales bacterium]